MGYLVQEAAFAAYFAEDLLQHSLRYRSILWKAPRPVHRQIEYFSLPLQWKFNENIGYALLLVHSKNESNVVHESTRLWRRIAKKPETSFFAFTRFIRRAYRKFGYSFDTLLLIFAVVVSACVPACRKGLFVVLKPASLSIRNALMSYSYQPSEFIRELQTIASRIITDD